MNENTLFRATGLSKRFGEVEVLQGLDLEIERRQIYGLLGPNGAGKTTAINILIGLLKQDRGTIEVGGSQLSPFWTRKIGVAPQDTALYPRLTCDENITFFGRMYGLTGRPLVDRVGHLSRLLGLEIHRNARVSTLSGGMQRRLNLAIAIVHEPELLILDEPTAGLDIDARYALWEVIPALRDAGAGILLTTHLLDEAAALCDRIGVLNGGRIVREGSLDELRSSIPAVQVAEVETGDEASLADCADRLGIEMRKRGVRHALMLPETGDLESVVESLRGTSIRSITLRPVGLEDVYFEAIA